MLIMILFSLGRLSRDIVSIFLGTLSRDIILIFLGEKRCLSKDFILSLCHKYIVGEFVFFSNSYTSFLFKWPFSSAIFIGFSRGFKELCELYFQKEEPFKRVKNQVFFIGRIGY